MKILVTGGCGFVGANLCLSLRKNNYKVFSLDNLVRKSSKINHNILIKRLEKSKSIASWKDENNFLLLEMNIEKFIILFMIEG